MASTNIKINYGIQRKYEAFYTGGKVQICNSGTKLYCQNSNKVNTLDVETGKVENTFGKEEDAEISCFVVSPDDEILVVASQHLLLKQWNLQDNTVSRIWKAIHTGPISTMTFDPTSTLLATGGSDSTIKVWDVIQRYCTHNLKGHTGVIREAKFHPDINKLLLYTGSDDNMIRVWSLQSSSCVALLEGHYSSVTSLQISTDQTTLYSASRDSVIMTWDLSNNTKLKTCPVYEPIESLILLPKGENNPTLNITTDDQHFVTAGSKGILRVWNSATSKCVFTSTNKNHEDKNEDSEQSIVSAELVPSTNTISTVTYDHNIIHYSLDDLSQAKQFVGYMDDVLDVKFLGVKDSHVAIATNSNQVKVFDVDSWSCQVLQGHTDIVMVIEVYRNGLLMATGSKDNNVRIWRMDADTSQITCVAACNGHTKSVNALAFSRLTASFLVTGGQDLTMKLWPLPDVFPLDEVVHLSSKVTELSHDKEINSITVAPNDKFVASGSMDKTAKLWKSSKLKMAGVFRGHSRGVWDVQFSSVDQCVATTSADATIRIWALSDFTCVKTFEGHQSSVLRVHFISHGMQLLSSGSDGLMKLWSIKNCECVKTFDAHEDKVWALSVSKDESLAVSGAGDSSVIVWKDITQEEQREALEKQEDFILKEQELSNLLQDKKYLKAIGLAITLDQPFKVLNILKDVLKGKQGSAQLEQTIGKLREDQLDAVLSYAVKWNTNSKHCHVAQRVVSIVLRSMTQEQLIALPSMKNIVEGFLPYSERHFQRMNKLKQQATFVEYTWNCMKMVGSSVDEESDKTNHEDKNVELEEESSSVQIPSKSQEMRTDSTRKTSDSEDDSSNGDFSNDEDNIETHTKNSEDNVMIVDVMESRTNARVNTESQESKKNVGKENKRTLGGSTKTPIKKIKAATPSTGPVKKRLKDSASRKRRSAIK